MTFLPDLRTSSHVSCCRSVSCWPRVLADNLNGQRDGGSLSWPVNLNSIQGDVQQTQQQQSKQQQHCCKSREKNISWPEHLQEDNFLLLDTFSSLCPRSSANYCIHENSLVRGRNSSSPPCSSLSLLFHHTAPVFIHVNKCSIEDQCSSK